MSIHNDGATEDSETESDRPPIGESAYSDRSSEVDGIVETDTSTTDCEAQRMRASPPAPPPLPPPPPPAKTNITMAEPKKKKPPAPKKKGQAQSKKRHAHDDDDDTEGPEDVSMVDAASPKKKSKKTHTSAARKKIHSKDGMTNNIGLPKYDKEGKELYCICRKPDTGKWMICCDGCEDWYHGECVKVKEEDGNLIDKYYCSVSPCELHCGRLLIFFQANTVKRRPNRQPGSVCAVFHTAANQPRLIRIPLRSTAPPNVASNT